MSSFNYFGDSKKVAENNQRKVSEAMLAMSRAAVAASVSSFTTGPWNEITIEHFVKKLIKIEDDIKVIYSDVLNSYLFGNLQAFDEDGTMILGSAVRYIDGKEMLIGETSVKMDDSFKAFYRRKDPQ